ncbi:hypothetical protein L873DRAFT_1828523 [Choiromyces venosus 120613-1]|uniref:Uncharacterized protein n=1 Tax=Choiromyces venosus 120613-1 TaxID=1336337 RepID=A0A3N4JXM5_9PEZI|nr:hypothetical protein L873DRAFT_1828523 [Choiromyces venosus 120613-1]
MSESFRRILPKHFHIPQTSPDSDNANKSLIKGSKKQPLKPFSSRDQSRRDFTVLITRFSPTFFALALLMFSLWGFSQVQPLSKWQQRSFNMLSILLTAIASLGLGSLLGHLGSMLRWPILARAMYQMRDVDSILGTHIREWRVSRTTSIATAHLAANVLRRLSVAIFGLGYNLTDETGIEYPILSTNWTSARWAGQTFYNRSTTIPEGDYERERFWVENEIGDDISSYLLSDLQVRDTTLKVGKRIVQYSYKPSNHTIHSAVSCNLIEVNYDLYWCWNSGNRTGPFSIFEESDSVFSDLDFTRKGNPEVVSKILRGVEKQQQNHTIIDPDIIQWISLLESGMYGSPLASQICDSVVWECWPTLTETLDASGSHQIQPLQKLFHSTDLFRLLTVGSGKWGYWGAGEDHIVFMNNFRTSLTGAAVTDGVKYVSSLQSSWRNSYSLYMAGIVARLPILAIMHANTALPKLARGPHPNQTAGTAYLHTTLEIDQ